MRCRLACGFMLFFAFSLGAQVVTYHPGFDDLWTTPGTPTQHPDQPVSLCPDNNQDDIPPCPCPRTAGFGMGIFPLNGAIYTIFQAKVLAASNPAGDYDHYATDPASVGDHLDAFYRYDDTGDPNRDGKYDRLPDFFALPPNGQLHTLSDDSVKQAAADTLPVPYQQSVTTGTAWQVGSAFTAFVGPRLDIDPAGAQRVYAFFAPESYPADAAIGGHLIGFASVAVPQGTNTVPQLWPGAWKDASSPNDGEYKLTNGLPLRTLYLREFTPVIAFRGDSSIRRDMTAPRPILFGRYLVGMAGWYRDHYFYLFLTTLLSRDDVAPETGDHCAATPNTRVVFGHILFRIRASETAAGGFGGLLLNDSKTPQVEVFRSSVQGGPRSFIPLPHPEKIVSFSDDNRPIVGTSCDSDNRQYFTGCCDNPAAPASWALIVDPIYTPQSSPIVGVSATFTWQDECSRYVVLNPPTPNPNELSWASNTTYNVGDVVLPTDRSKPGMECIQAGQSGNTEPAWPNFNDPSQDASYHVTDNTIVWKFAVGSLLLRLRDNAVVCGTGEPAYSLEDAGVVLHPYPDGYSHDLFYGPWANLWPLPGTTDTLLGFRHVRRNSDGFEGEMSFTVVPDLLNCRITISPTSAQASASASTSTITVTAPETRCVWAATTNASFLTITSSASGAGTDTVSYAVAANSGDQRSGTIIIAGQIFTVTQSAAQTSVQAPTGLVATRVSSTSASIVWQASPDAATYELFRRAGNGAFISISGNATSPFTDNTLAPRTTYLYKVRAVNGSGQVSAFSNIDLTTTVMFTDDPTVAEVTTVKAVHLTEIRQAVDAVRAAANIGNGSYTDDPIASGTTVIKAVHIAELRTQLADALVTLGFPAPSFSDTTLTAGLTPIRRVNVQELRDATK